MIHTLDQAVDRLREVICFKKGRRTWDARDREAVLVILAELERYRQTLAAIRITDGKGPP